MSQVRIGSLTTIILIMLLVPGQVGRESVLWTILVIAVLTVIFAIGMEIAALAGQTVFELEQQFKQQGDQPNPEQEVQTQTLA
ncbi:MAG: hypothetical protein A3D24_02735 [Candidatus Blackburnbacteria bacterium RIFCSPHIGHO2_02_FULL_39_13]|uniref:Uncharacterized protein n=1 Tax=Candidatus Blackburnbacteria bacterium RIFCSPLOWO2_01_FULL_40_20 TaxID=1797519 RepID=A0A1G1VBK9_9BACT|nr:MAG: hypothetical protein A2694_01640 [Candidatus Blackburnbacteria bacterium RIFCSPHIGHO2_01_FULL_40_17]OGY07741.1 MAG: hypothetical protein A3D24_02735 [Candidatus Blackburnbacteria bacterium RIFCSPHIGHO2_02_FULL_39_13]OGY12800.1 MAG: hypothetical protein A3A77_02900 [Candidatus Blackburnbacteria bacterium RIFCSPLOWO2_01_FULL_40_20]